MEFWSKQQVAEFVRDLAAERGPVHVAQAVVDQKILAILVAQGGAMIPRAAITELRAKLYEALALTPT